MGKINLCIALSLDGYIADSAGKVDFLFEKPRIEPDLDYREFYDNQIETILFGHCTYRQIVEDISPNQWGYEGKKCYVFSKEERQDNEQVTFTTLSPTAFVEQISAPAQKKTWLFGGRELIASFMKADLIDEYWLYYMPVLLGGGVSLFTEDYIKRPLTLTKLSKTDDIIKAFYLREQ